MVGSSISARLLRTLRHGSRTRAEIEQVYENTTMVETRFTRLRRSGLLEGEGEDLRLTAKGRRLVWLFTLLRSVFVHDAPNRPCSREN